MSKREDAGYCLGRERLVLEVRGSRLLVSRVSMSSCLPVYSAEAFSRAQEGEDTSAALLGQELATGILVQVGMWAGLAF